jgi:hypothetical protein
MATMEESVEVGCAPGTVQTDLITYFFRRSIGQYEAPDAGLGWNPGDDALRDGEFRYEPIEGGGTRLTARVDYDETELRADGGDEAMLRTVLRSHLAHISQYCGVPPRRSA